LAGLVGDSIKTFITASASAGPTGIVSGVAVVGTGGGVVAWSILSADLDLGEHVADSSRACLVFVVDSAGLDVE